LFRDHQAPLLAPICLSLAHPSTISSNSAPPPVGLM
jgi:hypothetical protein